MASIVSEFSLDKGDPALNRLINRVEAAQRQISAEFTLDEESSALSRMRRDLLLMIETIRKESVEFQNTVYCGFGSNEGSATGGVCFHSSRKEL
jgi:hypothetical protein